VEKDRAESLKSKEREKTLGDQAALDLLSISVMCKEKSMLEEKVEHSFWDRAESFIPEGRQARAAASKMGNCPETGCRGAVEDEYRGF
jgi:hypothetical protein